MRALRFTLISIICVVFLAVGALAYMLHTHPDYRVDNDAAKTPRVLESEGIKTLFLGTSSMAWTDGKSTWLVDGFFSRQPIAEVVLSRLKVNEAQVAAVASNMFEMLQMPPVLAGIVVAHSHYDHSMDAPFLSSRYGGRVVGSESTAQIALGQKLPATQVQVVPDNALLALGEFQIEFRKSAHAPTGFTGGFNTKPVELPAHALRFKEGISYSFVLSHPAMGDKPFALIQPSAGFLPGQNKGLTVSTVFLGTGGLGKLSDNYIEQYWQEMVLSTQAKKVYLIHWDDFTLPLLQEGMKQSLKPMPSVLDNFPRSHALLTMLSERDGVQLQVVDAWQMVYF